MNVNVNVGDRVSIIFGHSNKFTVTVAVAMIVKKLIFRMIVVFFSKERKYVCTQRPCA